MTGEPSRGVQGGYLRTRLLSPFRYPGGKTWLVPTVLQWFAHLGLTCKHYVEPFAGGSIVGLNIAYCALAEHVTLVELDEGVAAVWQTIIHGDAITFAERIATFNLSPESVNEVLSCPPSTLQDLAFRTIIRNRVNRAGILAPGAGMLQKGENGNGIKSRWYPETLRKRILEISRIKERITFLQADGLETLRASTTNKHAVFFVDPPYSAGKTKAAQRLYAHHRIDHQELFDVVGQLAGEFLMTYDDDAYIRELASHHGYDTKVVKMRTSHHVEKTELLISRDLRWFDEEANSKLMTVSGNSRR